MTDRRVLLISPAFHGYHEAIAASFEARGHTVTRHVYDEHVGLASRVGHRGAQRRAHHSAADIHRWRAHRRL